MVNGLLLLLLPKWLSSSPTLTVSESSLTTEGYQWKFVAFVNLTQHGHIILLDKVICLQVARSNNLSLTRYDRFSDLITHHVIVSQCSWGPSVK